MNINKEVRIVFKIKNLLSIDYVSILSSEDKKQIKGGDTTNNDATSFIGSEDVIIG